MIERMTRFYSSKKTFSISLIAVLILAPASMIMEIFMDDLIPFEWIAFLISYVLLIGLFITHRKQDYILMNGIISGILIYEFVRHAYLLYYFSDETNLNYYRSMGFFACFGCAFTFLSIAIVCLISYTHFTLNRSRAVNRTKIIFNQFLIPLLFLTPIVDVIIYCVQRYFLYEIIVYALVYLSDALLLLIVACCELEMATNRKDETVLEKPVFADIKAVIWYAFSFLFAVLCMSLYILWPEIKAFVLVLSNIDMIISLVLLLYYLNRKKKPSLGLGICLYAGLITTIGSMVFFTSYFIWTILS